MGRLEDGLPEPRGGDALLISRATYEKLRALVNRTVVLDSTQFESIERDGTTFYRLRPQAANAPAGGKGGGGMGGATIVPKAFRSATEENEEEEEVTKWYVTFEAAKLWEMSLATAGTGHDIKIPDLGEETDRTLDGEAEIRLEDGENEVWLKWTLKKSSEVEEDSAELVIGEAPSGTPYIPDWNNAGQDGAMVQHLGTITVSEGELPIWTPVAPHVVTWALVPGISYPGEKYSPIINYGSEMLLLRGVEQLVADGPEDRQDVVKAASGNDFQIRQIASRKAEGTEDMEEDEMPGGVPQIRVGLSEDGNAIVIRGNGYNKDVYLPGGWKMEIRDGLIQALTLQ